MAGSVFIMNRIPYYLTGTKVSNFNEACACVPFHIESEPAARLSTGKEIPGTQNLYRSDNGFCLGQHTKAFSFFQPCETLEAMEKARDFAGGQWSSVLLGKGGRTISAFCQIGETITAPKRGDTVSLFLAYTDGFDGSTLAKITLGANVLACTNGMIARESLLEFKGKHTSNLRSRFDLIEKQLRTNLALRLGETREIVYALDNRDMTTEEMTDFTRQLLPATDEENVPTRLQNRRDEIITGFTRGTGNVGRTRWDAFNAVTEHLDWQATYKETEFTRDENRIDSLLNGQAARVRDRALDLLLN